VTVLTPVLARRMLDVWHRRLLWPRNHRFSTTLLEEALGPQPAPPPQVGTGDYLKRPTWKHERGVRS
jgi:hypothetical protein